MLKLFRRTSVCFFLEVLGDLSLARKRPSSQLPVDPRGGGSGILAWRRPRSCCAMVCVSTPPRCDGHTHHASGQWSTAAHRANWASATNVSRKVLHALSLSQLVQPFTFSSARRSSRPPHPRIGGIRDRLLRRGNYHSPSSTVVMPRGSSLRK